MLGMKKTAGSRSLISDGMTVQGPCAFTGSLHIDGDVYGDIIASADASELSIGESGSVQGAISAGHVTIAGAVKGAVQALKLVLLPGARVHGDISYIALDMHPGATIVGRLLPQLPTASEMAPLTPAPEAAAPAQT